MQGLGLIDFDNFRERGKKSKVDLELDAQTLVDSVARAFAAVFPDARELDVRLYGGWTDTNGLPSRDACSLQGVALRDCTVVSVSIHRTSLETTKFVECNARDVLLMEPRVKVGSTRLELNGLRVPSEVIGIQVLCDEGIATVYAPERIARILGECGAPLEPQYGDSERHVPDELLDLLQRLMRAYERANPVCDGDQHLQRLFGDSHWPALRRVLLEHGIVKSESRPARGPQKEFLRRQFSPDAIMSGASRTRLAEPRIARFWDALEAMSV